jgi:tetrahydromethanopterin S-methyltransferase subunit B
MTHAELIRKIRRAESAVEAAVNGSTEDRLTVLTAILTQLDGDDGLLSRPSLIEPLVQICELVSKLIRSLDPESGAFRIAPGRGKRPSIPMFVLSSNVIGAKAEVPFGVVLETTSAALAARVMVTPEPSMLDTPHPTHVDSLSQHSPEEWGTEDEFDEPVPENEDEKPVFVPVMTPEETSKAEFLNETCDFVPSHNFVIASRALAKLRGRTTILRYGRIPNQIRDIWETLGASPTQVQDLWYHMFTKLWTIWHRLFETPVTLDPKGPDIENLDAGSIAYGVRAYLPFMQMA